MSHKTSAAAIFFITLFTLFVASSFIFSKTLFRLVFSRHCFQITTLLQHAKSEDFLPTPFLEELLDLSQDHPVILFTADTEEMEKKLMDTHAIKWAKVEKRGLNQLSVTYEMRRPFAIASDFENTYVDDEGALFAAHPFFSPKKLAEIYFGEEIKPSEVWKSHIAKEKMALAKEIVKLLSKAKVKTIDLSHLHEESLAQREIDLVFQDGTCVRLNPTQWKRQLENFAYLKREYLKGKKGPFTIDMRLVNVAFCELST